MYSCLSFKSDASFDNWFCTVLRSHRVFLFWEVLGIFPGVKLGVADWCYPASIQNEPDRGSSLDILFLLDEDIQKVVKNPIFNRLCI